MNSVLIKKKHIGSETMAGCPNKKIFIIGSR